MPVLKLGKKELRGNSELANAMWNGVWAQALQLTDIFALETQIFFFQTDEDLNVFISNQFPLSPLKFGFLPAFIDWFSERHSK